MSIGWTTCTGRLFCSGSACTSLMNVIPRLVVYDDRQRRLRQLRLSIACRDSLRQAVRSADQVCNRHTGGLASSEATEDPTLICPRLSESSPASTPLSDMTSEERQSDRRQREEQEQERATGKGMRASADVSFPASGIR